MTSEELKAKRRLYYLKNKEAVKARVKTYQQSVQGKAKRSTWQRMVKDKETPEQRKVRQKRIAEWCKKTKPAYYCSKHKLSEGHKTKCYLMNSLRSLIKGRIKTCRTLEKLMGVKSIEILQHFESQFLPHHKWENYGTVWTVDHIIPQAAFDLSKAQEVMKCFSLKNLRPMDKRKNRIEKFGFCNGVKLPNITKTKNQKTK